VPSFVPGLELARAFYEEVIVLLVGETPHSAALLGTGSEVLGYDSARSTDHGWGLRIQLFVDGENVEPLGRAIDEALPEEVDGWPTRFGWDAVPVSHHVVVATLADWLRSRLGFDPRGGATTKDWLATPQQILLETTRGAVFHDDSGELTAARDALAWYPHEVWLWLLACQWRRIDQEEPFVGRAAEAEDELGSRILASRLARDMIRLCFLQERRYAPYSKWLGSAFRELDAHSTLGGPLLELLAATEYERREAAFVEVVEALAAKHNALGITSAVDERVRLFHGRPYRVLGSGRFVDACLEQVSDPWLRSLPLIGGIDQFVDSTDVLSNTDAFPETRLLFDIWTR
jgi:hypothetical protein